MKTRRAIGILVVVVVMLAVAFSAEAQSPTPPPMPAPDGVVPTINLLLPTAAGCPMASWAGSKAAFAVTITVPSVAWRTRIDWGDGQGEASPGAFGSRTVTHTYVGSGQYWITIYPVSPLPYPAYGNCPVMYAVVEASGLPPILPPADPTPGPPPMPTPG